MPRSTKGDLESPWIWNEPQCPVLSTFNHCWVLHNVITFPVYFPVNVHPVGKFFMPDKFFLLNRDALLPCWHVLWCHLFFACFTISSSPLRSSFQSYSCGSESGGHPGGEERLLHCHEWRGHALQLGKLQPVLWEHLCVTSMCISFRVHVWHCFVQVVVSQYPTAAMTPPFSFPLYLSAHQMCLCVAVQHFLPSLYCWKNPEHVLRLI